MFTNKNITLAASADAIALQALLNSAYRGEHSKKGWTSEAHLIEGTTRATQEQVLEVLNMPESVFLKYVPDNGQLTGCVNLQKHDDSVYLGMFAVSPETQGGGIGKQLLSAAEEYASGAGSSTIYMSVIDIREELIAWYIRHGYFDTGERIPFPQEEENGRHTRPLQFMILEKILDT